MKSNRNQPMDIINATPEMFDRLMEIWESAIRATHDFLTEEKIVFYRKEIRTKYLAAIDELEVFQDGQELLGFVGITHPKSNGQKIVPAKIEMLFVDPAYHGKGIGRKLVEHIVSKRDPVELDVNEQNPEALGFYRHCGFQIVERSEKDGLGDPFPLLHLSNDRSILIRNEQPDDFNAIKEILLRAFEGHPHSNQMEYRLVELLREQKGLSLGLVVVSANAKKILGHIAFSPVRIENGNSDISINWFGIGPLAVSPEFQKQGIGSRLILTGMDEMRKRGASGCVLVGDPEYYKRFGFCSHPNLVVNGVPQEFVLVCSFSNVYVPKGEVVFHPAFEACSH